MKYQLISIVLLSVSYSAILAYSGEPVNSYPTQGNYPTGLCFDGENLWQADRDTDKIYCMDPNTGKVIRSIESPAYWPMGLAWDGKNLWNADFRGRTDKSEDRDGMIFKVDPEDGTILKTLRAPSKSPKGLTWDGKYLWCVDDEADKVIQFSTEDGTTIHSFLAPSSDPKGITYDGKYLWISDRAKNEIYMVDPQTGNVIVILDAPGKYVHGLAFSRNTLWTVDLGDAKIHELKVRDGEKSIRKDKKTYKVTYKQNVTCYGPGKILTLDVHIALPENRDNQTMLQQFDYNIQPTDILTDKWGQKTALYRFKNLKPGEKMEIQVTSVFETYNVRYLIYPEDVAQLSDIPQDIKVKYLADYEKYQIHSKLIQETLKEAVGDEENPYWIARKIHQYLADQLFYLMDGAWDTAPTVLTNGHGSCSEYSFAFIALCKAAGLPTRYVGATWGGTESKTMDNIFHRWVEVYLPNYGWIPIDPAGGDLESPRDQAFPFGLVRNSVLITTQSGGGSSTMGWTYNSNVTYTTEPKTNINIIHYADWEKVKSVPNIWLPE